MNRYRPIRTSAELVPHLLTIQRQPPPADLAEVVEEFWQYDVRPGVGAVPVQIYPSAYSTLRFNVFDNRVDAYLYGPSLSAEMTGLFLEGFAIFGAALKPTGVYRFMGLAMSEVRDLRIDLDWVWPALIFQVKEQLWETSTFAERVPIMSTLLRRTVRSDAAPHPDFLNAFAALGVGRGVAPNALSGTVRASPRVLRRYFDRFAGLSPKQVDRVLRFQGALGDLARRPACSLPDIAAHHGYADQAHLTREFKRLSNVSPGWFRNNIASLGDSGLPIWRGLSRDHYYQPSMPVISFARGVR
jgi:AraC-like DNA-binding protein